jgi:hypothetical protein
LDFEIFQFICFYQEQFDDNGRLPRPPEWQDTIDGLPMSVGRMLVDARDDRAQAVVASYINTRLPSVIAQVEAIFVERGESQRQGAVASKSNRNTPHL